MGTIGNNFHRGGNEIMRRVGGRLWGASLESAGGDAGEGARATQTRSVIVLHVVLHALGQLLDLFCLLDHIQREDIDIGLVHLLLEFDDQ